jgi:hypothetical protein
MEDSVSIPRRRTISPLLLLTIAVALGHLGASASGASEELWVHPSGSLEDSSSGIHRIAPAAFKPGVRVFNLGRSVGVYGDTLIATTRGDEITEPWDNPGDPLLAVVLVYKRSPLGARPWEKVKELRFFSFNEFYPTVAMSSDAAFVGMNEGLSPPTVIVLDQAFDPTERITPSDGAGAVGFGERMAVSGDTLAVSAPRLAGVSPEDGAVYVFDRTPTGTGNWVETTRVMPTPGDIVWKDQFGYSLALDGDRLAAGVFKSNRVFIFERDHGGTDNWGQVKKIRLQTAQLEVIGPSIALDGDTLVVGAPGEQAAYIYERNQGGADNWGQVKKLVPTGGSDYGEAVAIVGDTVFVTNWSGGVTVYERDEGGADNWGEKRSLGGPDGPGNSLSAWGDTLVAGGPEEDELVDHWARCGAVYAFDRNEGGPDNWGETGEIYPDWVRFIETFVGETTQTPALSPWLPRAASLLASLSAVN